MLIFHAMAIMRGGLFAFIQGKAVERAQALAVAKAHRLSDKAVNKLEGQNKGADAALAAVTLSAAGERLGDCGARSGVECWLAYEPRKPAVEGRFWELLRARGLHASRLRLDELPPGSPPDIEILRIRTAPV